MAGKKAKKETKETKETKYAGFWIRFGAMFIDGMILSMIFFMVAAVFFAFLKDGEGPMDMIMNASVDYYDMATALIFCAYSVIFSRSKWQATPGKRICGIYVRSDDGQKLGKFQAIHRFLAFYFPIMLIIIVPDLSVSIKFLSMSGNTMSLFFIVVAVIWYGSAGWNKKKRAVHDRLCESEVIYGVPAEV